MLDCRAASFSSFTLRLLELSQDLEFVSCLVLCTRPVRKGYNHGFENPGDELPATLRTSFTRSVKLRGVLFPFVPDGNIEVQYQDKSNR